MSARDLQSDLNRLVGGGQGFSPLDPMPPRGSRPGARSLGLPGGGLGGDDADAGGAVEDFELTSSDGLFALQLRTEVLPSGNKALIAPEEEEEEEG